MRHFQSLLYNRELHVISHTKQPAVQEKAARSVCPKAGPEQQLLITEVQAKRALHSPGVHWEPGIVNRLLYTWRTCQSSSICVCVYIIIFYCYFDNMNIFFYFVFLGQTTSLFMHRETPVQHIPKFAPDICHQNNSRTSASYLEPGITQDCYV